MAASLADYQTVTMTPSAAIDASIEYDREVDGTISSGAALSRRRRTGG